MLGTSESEASAARRVHLAQRMLVVSAVTHHQWDGSVWGYTPYVREVSAWAHLFGEVRIAAPVVNGPPPDDCAAFTSANITLAPMPATGGPERWDKFRQILLVPLLAVRLITQMIWADAIQVRCPSNLGVLAVPLAPLFARRLHCKYAGMWGVFEGEPWSSKFQRRMLISRWWRGPVSVYGPAQTDPAKIHASFSTALTEAQLAVRRTAEDSSIGSPVRLLFVGRLSAPKNVDTVLRALARVRQSGGDCTLAIVGSGPERETLESLVHELAIADIVTFCGALPVDEVLAIYRRSDVMVLVSNSEGWPKVIVEAMSFGVVVVGNDRGLVPMITGEGRGFSLPPGDVDALAETLTLLVQLPQRRKSMADAASPWARRFSLERFADDLCDVLVESWPTPGSVRPRRERVPR